VLGQVLRESLMPVAIGVIAGSHRVGRDEVYRVAALRLEPRDPSTMVAARD